LGSDGPPKYRRAAAGSVVDEVEPPDAVLFPFHIEQTCPFAGHLCGRGLYEVMLVWETAEQTMSDEAELQFAGI